LTNDHAEGEVVVSSLEKSYGLGPFRKIIFRDCTLKVAAGNLTVLIGPSGCGKSTLINILAGYEMPDRGQVLVDGIRVMGPDADRIVVFQETALFPWKTVFQNITYGPEVQRLRSRADIESDAIRLLDKVGLRDFKDKFPAQLSGGMQRRAELARAMINNPKVMLLDEPFRGLDAMTRELMQEYFIGLFEDRRQTTLFVTSEIEEAIFLADTLMIMSNRPGKITKTMSIDLARPRKPDVLTSSEYLRYKEEAMEMLHEEAVKAFAAGSKAAADFLEGYAKRDDKDPLDV
jgi:sulfonate transport system ATP-binding protein